MVMLVYRRVPGSTFLVGGLEHEFYDFPDSWDDDPI